MAMLGILNALEKDNERLRMINYQFIVKCECQSTSLAGYKEALISCS